MIDIELKWKLRKTMAIVLKARKLVALMMDRLFVTNFLKTFLTVDE